MNAQQEGLSCFMAMQRSGLFTVSEHVVMGKGTVPCHLSVSQWIDTKELKLGYVSTEHDIDVTFAHTLPYEGGIRRIVDDLKMYA